MQLSLRASATISTIQIKLHYKANLKCKELVDVLVLQRKKEQCEEKALT